MFESLKLSEVEVKKTHEIFVKLSDVLEQVKDKMERDLGESFKFKHCDLRRSGVECCFSIDDIGLTMNDDNRMINYLVTAGGLSCGEGVGRIVLSLKPGQLMNYKFNKGKVFDEINKLIVNFSKKKK